MDRVLQQEGHGPETGNTQWKRVRVNLGLRSKQTKYQAREALETQIAKQTGGSTQARPDSRIVTLGWFTRNRFFPLREGSRWRKQTAVIKKIQIERDILDQFGAVPLEEMDQVMLQMHLNDLATQKSRDRVKQARCYMRAIFSAAVDQDFIIKDPTRMLAIPKELRPVDRTTLSWDQLRKVLASVELKDRLLLTLEMAEALRPGELFALRWKNFSFDERTLEVTETGYKGQLRPYGKTRRALGRIHLPEGLANDLWLWRQECPDPSPEAFIFPTARRSRKTGGRTFIDTGNYRHRVMKKLAEDLGLPKLNFQVLRRTIATLAQKMGSLKDVQGVLRHDKIDTTGNVYMQEIERSVQRTVNSIYRELRAKPKVKTG